MKFGYTGQTIAITFGPHTVNKTLVGYRMDGMDWQFTNVTTGGTHLFVTPANHPNATYPINPSTFELRVSNWGYGIQIDQVHVAAGEKLLKVPDFGRTIEFIGDSLQAGMYTSYEAMSGFAYECGAGLGNTEFSVTAYPGICVSDQDCWGNPRGHAHQWFYASDTSWRASDIWGDNPEPWNFSNYPAADLVVINIGTNDANSHNNVSNVTYVESYKKLIAGVHGIWPSAQVVVMVSCPLGATAMWRFLVVPALTCMFSVSLERVVSVWQQLRPRHQVHARSTGGVRLFRLKGIS